MIELDGSVHNEEGQKENDAKRERALKELGLRVVRFGNDEVERDLQSVLGKIRELISNTT